MKFLKVRDNLIITSEYSSTSSIAKSNKGSIKNTIEEILRDKEDKEIAP